MRISDIRKTKKGRFALFDEQAQFLFSVDGETLAKAKIAQGTELDDAALRALHAQSETRRAKDKALCYLSVRDHAAGELYEKLCRTFDAPSAAAAVAEMRRLDLLDDEAFAQRYAAQLIRRCRSRREIAAKLAEKGIGRETADAVLAEMCPDETQACCALIEKQYLPRLRAGQTEKVLAALARRGFSYGAARAALERCREAFACGQMPQEDYDFITEEP